MYVLSLVNIAICVALSCENALIETILISTLILINYNIRFNIYIANQTNTYIISVVSAAIYSMNPDANSNSTTRVLTPLLLKKLG